MSEPVLRKRQPPTFRFVAGPRPAFVPKVRTPSPPISSITDNLFLGNIEGFNDSVLSEHKITHIVSLFSDGSKQSIVPEDNVLSIQMLDDPGQPVKHVEALAVPFIKKAIDEGGNVFVHCQAGISRSATIVALFLMRHMGMTCDEALDFIREKRHVDVNIGFYAHLACWKP